MMKCSKLILLGLLCAAFAVQYGHAAPGKQQTGGPAGGDPMTPPPVGPKQPPPAGPKGNVPPPKGWQPAPPPPAPEGNPPPKGPQPAPKGPQPAPKGPQPAPPKRNPPPPVPQPPPQKPQPKVPVYQPTPAYKVVYKQPVVIYYCVELYYDTGYCPSNSYSAMKGMVDDYNNQYGNVYGCSFGPGYSYGPQNTEGGYVCFATQVCAQQFVQYCGQPKYVQSGFAATNSGHFNYKYVQYTAAPSFVYQY